MVYGKVFLFGLIFRVEKLKICRYLIEFWMIEGEMVFINYVESLEI